MNITADTMAFVTVIFVIISTIFNIVSAKRSGTKDDLQRIYDKIDTIKDDYNCKITEVKQALYDCQVKHSAMKNGQV